MTADSDENRTRSKRTRSKKAKSSSSGGGIKKGMQLRALVRMTGDETDEELEEITNYILKALGMD
jgi:hypothetical protein